MRSQQLIVSLSFREYHLRITVPALSLGRCCLAYSCWSSGYFIRPIKTLLCVRCDVIVRTTYHPSPSAQYNRGDLDVILLRQKYLNE